MQRLDEGRLVLRLGGQPPDLLVALLVVFIMLFDHQRLPVSIRKYVLPKNIQRKITHPHSIR